MTAGRPRLLLVKGAHVSESDLVHLLGDHYEVMMVDPATVAAGSTVVGGLGPRGLAGAQAQGYQAVLCDAASLSSLGGPVALPSSDRLSEGEASAALSSIGEGVCLCSLDGVVVWANDRFRNYDEQTRARIAAVCRRAAQQYQEQMLQQEAAGFSAGNQKFEVASPDESRFYEVVVSPVKPTPTQSPSPANSAAEGVGAFEPHSPHPFVSGRVAAVIWDVTSSRQMQQKMDAIDRAGTELVRLDAESIRKKHVIDRIKLLQEKIVKFSHDLLRFDHLAVRLINERTGQLELVMASGLSPEAMDVELYAQKEGNGIMGYVAATGRSYLCPDVSKDRRYVMGLSGARSSLTVPLRLNDKVIGAFNVESENLAAFTEEDRQFAEIFANHVALAIHILDLLVVERCATGETVTGTVQGELNEPLDDIMREADWLRQAASHDPNLRPHIERIIADVGAIRERVREAAAGPQNILGVEKVLADIAVDPLLAGKHILVADDEPKIRQLIREVLKGKGCRVVVCGDGTEAISYLKEVADGRLPKFDLVISDIKMPDRNGYEVFSAARALSTDLPVILMTGFGYDPHHSIVRASQEGLQCVLFKPFQIERLLEEVKKAMKQPV